MRDTQCMRLLSGLRYGKKINEKEPIYSKRALHIQKELSIDMRDTQCMRLLSGLQNGKRTNEKSLIYSKRAPVYSKRALYIQKELFIQDMRDTQCMQLLSGLRYVKRTTNRAQQMQKEPFKSEKSTCRIHIGYACHVDMG